jgi:hypothetical protein
MLKPHSVHVNREPGSDPNVRLSDGRGTPPVSTRYNVTRVCKRCGGCSELALTLSHERYDIYQCLDCKFVDWIARETREPKGSLERSARTDSIDEG